MVSPRALCRANRFADSIGLKTEDCRLQTADCRLQIAVCGRDTLVRWSEKKGVDGLREYRRDKNTRSITGLPGISD